MYSVKSNIVILFFGVVAAVFGLSQCNHSDQSLVSNLTAQTSWWNLGDSATYVGIETCKQCHQDIYNTFIETGMGQSFGLATQQKSAGKFAGTQVIFDAEKQFYYRPYWQGEQLWVQEYRLNRGDTSHSIHQKVDYIVGSGQHTNSHIFIQNGYAFQAPFTFYTQKQKLDLPPGFEGGQNSRFSRIIGVECMSCHNAMPTGFVAGSENKFDIVANGIDCERCHGPGSLHVARIQRGVATDTSKSADYSIVNPKRLSPQLQFQICQRCHLQGNAVLKPGKSFFDFRPAMHLDSVMDVYLPRTSKSEDEFIMASHADRFSMSKCFVAGQGKYVCTSCHNPHVSVKKTDPETFNNTCKSCHKASKPNHGCTANFSKGELATLNCVGCHMPQSGSTDIPHVSVHDHYIRAPKPLQKTNLATEVFLGLKAINTKKPSHRSRINAFLQQFERFEPRPYYLDSAYAMLKKQPISAFKNEWIHYYYLRNEPSGIVKTVEENGKTSGWLTALNQKSWDNAQAWTAYRISEAYRKFTDYSAALLFAQRAVQLAPHVPEFLLKKSNILALQGKFAEAEKGYREVVTSNPLSAEGWSDLSYVLLAQEKIEDAEKAALQAKIANPDYVQGKVNLASVYLAQQKWREARLLLEEIVTADPNNKRAQSALDYLKSQKLGN